MRNDSLRISKSKELYERALRVMPGGVNSPVRAFNAVGGNPVFIERGKGAKIYDVDGNEYIDFVGSWGPMILGHADEEVIEAVGKRIDKGLSFGACSEIEVEMAELITEIVPGVDKIRMVSSGTEAVMSAIRLARGFTGRDKIVKFEGCYHGHSDSMLVKAGSGSLTGGNPDSAGVTPGVAKDTLIATFNDYSGVEEIFRQNEGEIAAIIVEPVGANMGVIPPMPGFLKELRRICDENKSLLIFDEVITGFRISLGGAMDYYGIDADIVTYGKIIGGGMPVGAYGGKKDIMEFISPIGNVYQAGTLSGNPIAMAAGIATISILKKNPDIYVQLRKKADMLVKGLKEAGRGTVNQVESLVCQYFTDVEVKDYKGATSSNLKAYAAHFNKMLQNGVYIAPAQFEAMFISSVHTKKDIDYFIGLL